MEIFKKNVEGKTVLSIKGRLDATNADFFEKELLDIISKTQENVLLNLQDLVYISSIGLRGLITSAKKLKKLGKELILFSPQENIKEIFHIAGFNQILKILDTQEEALQVVN